MVKGPSCTIVCLRYRIDKIYISTIYYSPMLVQEAVLYALHLKAAGRA